MATWAPAGGPTAPGAGWGAGPAGGAGRPSLGGAAGSWAFTSCAPHTHALCPSLPRARAGLCAQRHHHRGELPPSPPGRLGGRDGVLWEGCHSKVQVKGARGTCPTHTFLSSRASQASWSGTPTSPGPGPRLLALTSRPQTLEHFFCACFNLPLSLCLSSLSAGKALTLTVPSLRRGGEGREQTSRDRRRIRVMDPGSFGQPGPHAQGRRLTGLRAVEGRGFRVPGGLTLVPLVPAREESDG